MARTRVLAGRSIEQYDSPNQGGSMTDCHGVVLHIAEGSYRGTISWQMNPDQRYSNGTKVNTCSTWIVGLVTGEWAQMVDTARIAWCQRDGSRTWLSIELAGRAPAAPTAWQIEACAQLLAWAHREHGVPLQVADHPGERGLGHHSMDREWLGEEWGHDACPGAGVIAAKSAIVARAKAIVAGEDDIMGALSDTDQKALIWRVEALAAGRAAVAGGPTRGAVVVPNVRLAAIEQKVAALGTAVAAVAPDVAGRLRAEFERIDTANDELLAAVDQVDEAVVEAIGAGDRPETIAERLRAVLGDQAAAVGQLLAQG